MNKSICYIDSISIFRRVCMLSVLFMFFLLFPQFADAQAFAEGEAMFRADKPDLAIPLFQKAILQGQIRPSVYNYLGIALLQTGQTKKALDTFIEGTNVAGTDKRSLYYNAGNAAFLLDNYEKAREYFSLCLAADSAYAAAYLNRGNTNVQLAEFSPAIEDYNKYLVLAPDSSQADAVRRMIAALNGELNFQREEKVRLAAEAERIKQEEARLKTEQERLRLEKERIAAEKAAAEAERRRKILAEVSASLQAGESVNLSAGTEGVLKYDYKEAELE